MSMRVVLVDDERLARDELRRMLKVHEGVDIVGEAANILQAQQVITEVQPDLLFLDIQMPGGSGFDLLEQLDDAPDVIFTTGYDQYAIRAFEVSALDYLLKPVDVQRLELALLKHFKLKQLKQAVDSSHSQASPTLLALDSKVFIKDGEHCWFIALEKIALFESEGNYARVYFEQHRPLLLRSLNQLEERLDSQHFVRISRRHIVNLAFVQRIVPSAAGGLLLHLQGGVTVEMSRRRAQEFKQFNRL
jgi:two-component system LytT family response regulator